MVDAVANQPDPAFRPPSKLSSFKISEPQYVQSVDPSSNPEEMESLNFQGIGGHEIISLARRDLIDGTNINYQIISNLKRLYAEYNPKTIVSIENSSPLYFNSFGIKFENYLPSEISLKKIDPTYINPVTIDANNNINIYVSNIKDSYEVEVQALAAEEWLRDTIYEENQS